MGILGYQAVSTSSRSSGSEPFHSFSPWGLFCFLNLDAAKAFYCCPWHSTAIIWNGKGTWSGSNPGNNQIRALKNNNNNNNNLQTRRGSFLVLKSFVNTKFLEPSCQQGFKTIGQASNWTRMMGSSVLFNLLFYSLSWGPIEPRMIQTHHVAKDTQTSDPPTSTSDCWDSGYHCT